MTHASDIAVVVLVAALLSRWAALIVGASFHAARARRCLRPEAPAGPPESWPRVTVVVPAKDEEDALGPTVEAVLRSDHPSVDVVIVDDGSVDGTARVAAALAAAHPRVRVLTHVTNRGKAAALNTALHATSSEIVVTVDADTHPAPDCIRRLAARLADPAISAAACNIKVANRSGWLGCLQSLEYVAELGVDQRALALSDAITVVAGATAGWRKDAVLAVSGFSSDTLTEDTDLTITLLRAGHGIAYVPDAVARTFAPASLGTLLRQRRRWLYGNLQSAWKHRAGLLRGPAAARWIALPNWWFINLGVFLLLPIWLSYLPHALTHYSALVTAGIMGGALSFEIAHCVLGHALDRELGARLLVAPLQRLLWPFFLWFVFVTVIATRLRGRRVGWRGTAPVELPHATRQAR